MIFGVPQYVDIEDKIAFRLTLKQLGWFALAGMVAFAAFQFLETWAFIIVAIISIALGIAFAFYQPAGLSLFNFLLKGTLFSFAQKRLVWDKGIENLETEKVRREDKEKYEMKVESKANSIDKGNTLKNLDTISEILDRKSNL